MTDRELLKQALGALEKSLPRLAPNGESDWLDSKEVIANIRAHLDSSPCKLGCTDVCKAKEHGCASECPALPWQPQSEPDGWLHTFKYLSGGETVSVLSFGGLGDPPQVSGGGLVWQAAEPLYTKEQPAPYPEKQPLKEAILAEPTAMIHKWRVLELIEYCAKPALQPGTVSVPLKDLMIALNRDAGDIYYANNAPRGGESTDCGGCGARADGWAADNYLIHRPGCTYVARNDAINRLLKIVGLESDDEN